MLKEIAIKIRHHSLLEKHEWLWNLLRKPYYFFINFNGKGVNLIINKNLTVKLPPEYYNPNIINYEVKSVNKLIEWIKINPDNYIFDVGCSVGYISAFALFASSNTRVFAFDADKSSLSATKRMCQYSSNKKLSSVYGLISDDHSSEKNITQALTHTDNELSDANITGLPGTTRYINLDMNSNNDIPVYSIDNLFRNFDFQANKFLIKCDVEGAELFVLYGAKEFILKYKPKILLSVHPQIISIYHHTVLQIKQLLLELSYSIEIIDIDHEEHWWCSNKD